MDKILKEIRVLSNVVNDFLTFARKQALTRTRVQVRARFEDVSHMVEANAKSAGVNIEIEVDDKLSAQLDHQAMRAALLNLVQNALQASPSEGRVVMTGEGQENTLQIEIRDQGDGVPKDKVSEIFTPFFTTKQKGTGLGLALVRKTVVAHQGTITYEENQPKGAKFIVRIPSNPSFEPISEPGLLD